jgi:hypothetical protein
VGGVRFVDEIGFGFGWIAPEPRFMQRTSHVLASDGRVWVIDPVADESALVRACELGDPAGVLQLLDRHGRDCRTVAEQLGVAEKRILVCADAVGTAQYYRASGERLAVSPLLRMTPPRRLLVLEPQHVLVGHGEGIHADATAALRDAVGLARRRTPSWAWAGLRAHARFHRPAR